MKPDQTGARLLQGAFILSAAALLSKLIGTLQKIPLQNMGGDAVFGIYNTVYPFYMMIITIAAVGFPAAVSKYVAEYEAEGRTEDGHRLLRLSSAALVLFGLILGFLMYVCAPRIGMWIGSSQVVPALRAGALALAFVPWMSVLRGYFQGLHNMVPTAISQITEQIVRVGVMIVLLLYMIRAGSDPDVIAAGALLGSAAGGAAGLLVMGLYWRKHIRATRSKTQGEADHGFEAAGMNETGLRADVTREGAGVLLGRLLAYGIPVCLSLLAVPLIGLVDTFTVPRLLTSGGLGEAMAMAEFGVYNRGLPLVQLVTMLATSLSVLFIPALAEAKFKGESSRVAGQTRMALRWFWLIGMTASVGLAVLAEPINIMLYEDAAGTATMQVIAFTAAGGTLSTITAALLQGIGIVKAPAVHLLAAAGLKLLLNLLLVPQFGITGAAIAGVAAHLTAAALNLALLSRSAGARLDAGGMLARTLPVLAAVSLAAWGAGEASGGILTAAGFASGRLTHAAASLSGVAAGCGAFLIGAALMKLLTEEELRMLPKVGRPLAAFLRALRVLR
ncbi:putative polysaccharide biosynthesis protein [Paenibacillus lautus]|uniref:putative polysaccharide biosynthesis protein n=1 Tax=Paenibacillus lautus TaxID=1401 RepID=UPI002DBB1980|nr:polysaccharide biosynthesis protein [Paenibacillus lautus]MEC0259950.1 polysaccharide biosynthesis protein [Paenibacillus lautus]